MDARHQRPITCRDADSDGCASVADRDGAFGNPTSDSLRTSVEPKTTALWMVIFAPSSYPAEQMDENVRFARDAMERHLAPRGRTITTKGGVWDGSAGPWSG